MLFDKVDLTKIGFVLISAITGCACSDKIYIDLKRNGPVTVVNIETLVGSYAPDRYKGGFDTVLQSAQAQENSFYNTAMVGKFLVVPISADRDLWHAEGASNNIDPVIYPCDRSGTDHGTFAFRVPSSAVETAYPHDIAANLSFLFENGRESAVIKSPLVDICLRVERGSPNENPYLNGHTDYTSNELRIPASELAALLDPLINPVAALPSSSMKKVDGSSGS